MKWFLKRLREPSTYAGIAAAASGAAFIAADPKNPQSWAVAIGGLLAVAMPEKGAE